LLRKALAYVPFANGQPAGPIEDFVTGFIADEKRRDEKRRQVYGRPVRLAMLRDGAMDRCWSPTMRVGASGASDTTGSRRSPGRSRTWSAGQIERERRQIRSAEGLHEVVATWHGHCYSSRGHVSAPRNDIVDVPTRSPMRTAYETRYQLKLLREFGTIKADLFAGHADAVAASRQWREEFDIPRGG
jgi:hypothetical protein